jgi:acyl-CoA synthetase (NDP forming)
MVTSSTQPTTFSGIHHFLWPKSIAIIGASTDPSRIGGRPLAYMCKMGYEGLLFPVNPNHQCVQGIRAFETVASLPEAPDLAIVAVPFAAVQASIEDLGRLGAKWAIIFSAGFAEAGALGAELQRKLGTVSRAYGMRILGPNCIGAFNARNACYATFSSSLENGFPAKGRIAIASQSGAYGTHLFAAARALGLGVPTFISTGNEVDVSLGEVIGALVEDDEVDVIAAYAEGIREANSFVAALEAARCARKPVVMMKVGRSAGGAAAAQSHTAALAGEDFVTNSVLDEFGVVRARSTEELLDVVRMALRRVFPVNITLGVLTVSGGAGVLICDEAAANDLPMPALAEAAQADLLALVPYAAVRNPVDCTAQVLNDYTLIGRFADIIVDQGGYSAVLSFFSQLGESDTVAPLLRRELREVLRRHPGRLHVLSILAPPERLREFEDDGFVVFTDPSRAVVAIRAMGTLGEAFARPAARVSTRDEPIEIPEVRLNETEAKRLLAAYGIKSVPERVCRSSQEAATAAEQIGYPVVMKILSPDIPHKSEMGGVLLGLKSKVDVRAGFAMLHQRALQCQPGAKVQGVIVARQMQGGVECILGIQRDPVFGPVAIFGLGGILVEILAEIVCRRCPFDQHTAKRMILGSKAARVLAGVRGNRRADVDALAVQLAKLSQFAARAGARLQSIDLNPVLVLAEGEGAFALDAFIQLQAS